MIKNLIKVANRLDSLGLTKEADFLDKIIQKIALTEEDFSGNEQLTIAVMVNMSFIPDELSEELDKNLNELLIDGPRRAIHIGTSKITGQIDSKDLLTFNPISPIRDGSRFDKPKESFSVKLKSKPPMGYNTDIYYYNFIIPSGYSPEARSEGIDLIRESAKRAVELSGLSGKAEVKMFIGNSEI